MRINHNIQALNAYRQLSKNQNLVSKHLEKLSSGLRINRAGDDAAGLAISEKMRSQIRGLAMAERNALDGISLIQTAEGAMDTVHSMLQRARELAVQAANGTYSLEDNREIQKEINQLLDAIDQISTDTEFNTKKLLNGDLAFRYESNGGTFPNLNFETINQDFIIKDSAGVDVPINLDKDYNDLDELIEDIQNKINDAIRDGDLQGSYTVKENDDGNGFNIYSSVKFEVENSNGITGITAGDSDGPLGGALIHIGANSNQHLVVDIGRVSTDTLGDLPGGKSLADLRVQNVETATQGGLLTQGEANDAIEVIQKAIDQISAERSKLGAYQNRLEHTINNLAQTQENLTAAESRIRDADMALEMTNFTKNNIINQSAMAMLAQANQLPQGILQLLK